MSEIELSNNQYSSRLTTLESQALAYKNQMSNFSSMVLDGHDQLKGKINNHLSNGIQEQFTSG